MHAFIIREFCNSVQNISNIFVQEARERNPDYFTATSAKGAHADSQKPKARKK